MLFSPERNLFRSFFRPSPVERAGADELRERLLVELVEKEALARVREKITWC